MASTTSDMKNGSGHSSRRSKITRVSPANNDRESFQHRNDTLNLPCGSRKRRRTDQETLDVENVSTWQNLEFSRLGFVTFVL